MSKKSRLNAARQAQRRGEADGGGPGRFGDRWWEAIAVLRGKHEQRVQLDVEIVQLVGLSRLAGASWGDIGRALGMSRQGARQRYGEAAGQYVHAQRRRDAGSDVGVT